MALFEESKVNSTKTQKRRPSLTTESKRILIPQKKKEKVKNKRSAEEIEQKSFNKPKKQTKVASIKEILKGLKISKPNNPEEMIEEVNDSDKNQKKKQPAIKNSVAELIPIIDMTEEGYFELRDNEGYFHIVQIEGKDIYSRNESESEFDIMMFTQFYRAFHHCVKITCLNFPVETKRQQAYIEKKIEENKNPYYEEFLRRKLKELTYLEWKRSNREYFLTIYGPNIKILEDRIKMGTRLIEKTLHVHEISTEKKLEFLYKLNNLNSKISSKR
ncbi:hypothetical protein [Bacillus subtilis]|uniref:hypothetical protein n=1 Tax=Bacillus subtilis TaxID=1423 RepID=UPI0034E1F0F0